MLPDQLCKVCRQRLDAVLTGVGRHPNCGPCQPLTDAAFDRLVDHLIAALVRAVGATTITSERNAA